MEVRPDPFVRHGKEEDPIEISADEVLNAIAEGRDIDISYAIINGDLIIERIADRLERNKEGNLIIRGSIRIYNSEIRGRVAFFHIALEGTEKEDHGAICVAFYNEVSFSFSTFNEDAHFCCIFSEDVNFVSATFRGDTFFSSSVFKMNAHFNYAVFSELACFNPAVFDGSVYFDFAIFSGGSYFTDAVFNVAVHFENVQINRPADFAGVRFHENTVYAGLKNEILCPIVKFLTRGKREPKRKPVTNFSRFNTSIIMDSSTNSRLKRYVDDEQWIDSWRSSSKLRKFLFVIWELTSHCGRSIGLWAGWAFLFVLFFTVVYTPSPDWMPDWWSGFWQERGAAFEQVGDSYKGKPVDFLSCLYFSIVTFTTLGFGDITPANSSARLLVTVEVVLGYVMLGGLISIFANKFARRG